MKLHYMPFSLILCSFYPFVSFASNGLTSITHFECMNVLSCDKTGFSIGSPHDTSAYLTALLHNESNQEVVIDEENANADNQEGALQGFPLVREMVVYPNPAKDEINVIISGDIAGKYIQIIDMSGKVHMEALPGEWNKKTVLDISSLSAGIYMLSLTTDNGKVFIQKFYKVDY